MPSKDLSHARRRTTDRLRGLELPACFIEATHHAAEIASSSDTVEARAARRRLRDKSRKLTTLPPSASEAARLDAFVLALTSSGELDAFEIALSANDGAS
jgi:hypothetical protein